MNEKNHSTKIFLVGMVLVFLISAGSMLFMYLSSVDKSFEVDRYISADSQASVCSALCLENPINMEPHLLRYFRTNQIHVFYEPYFRDLKIYDYNKVEHKQCCLRVS